GGGGGTEPPAAGAPTNVAVPPRSVAPPAQPPFLGLGNFAATGTVGGAYAPLIPGGSGDLLRDLRLTLPPGRLDDRRRLLRQLDRVERALEYGGGVAGPGPPPPPAPGAGGGGGGAGVALPSAGTPDVAPRRPDAP